jgi:hypothetical protein
MGVNLRMKNPWHALYLFFLVIGIAWALLSFGPYVPHDGGHFRACSADHGVAFVDSDRYTFVIDHQNCPEIRTETPLTVTRRFSGDQLCAGTRCFTLASHRPLSSLW